MMTGVSAILAIVIIVMVDTSLAKNHGSFNLRYDPLPECPEAAVCADVFTLNKSPRKEEDSLSYHTSYVCQCPEDQECPTRPGTHTLHIQKGRWYSMCKPVCSFKKCEYRQVAEEVLWEAHDFGDRTYTKVNCLCHGYEDSDMDGDESASKFKQSKTDDPRAKVVYQRVCSESPTWKRSNSMTQKETVNRRMSINDVLAKKWSEY